MVRRVMRAGTIALMLAALLGAGVGHGYALYRCRVDRVARTSCCCPTENHDERGAAIGAARCCDRELVQISQLVQHTEEHAPLAVPLARVGAIVLAPLSGPLSSGLRRVAPPGLGPPLLLVKSSRLI